MHEGVLDDLRFFATREDLLSVRQALEGAMAVD
jgi:hypothetical protein